MSQPNPADAQKADLPTLWKDSAYHGMNLTQFLGAFNDNLFKQLVLLICVDYARTDRDYQMVAQALFALPFVLFSGVAGFLADRISKQRIVVSMKIVEIGIMSAGYFAFHATSMRLGWLLLVVFAMGTHSAFFGPAKYGILPELFRGRDLPQVNGTIQMTTFLAIIFGAALAGFTKEQYADRLWIGSAICIAIAVLGTCSSLLVRRTPVADPVLKLAPGAFFGSRQTWRMIVRDRPLLVALIVSSLFWFLGGVIQPSVNAFGKLQLEYGDGRTSVMTVCMAIGIMIGCVWSGKASRGRIRFDFVRLGAWGIVACLIGVAVLGAVHGQPHPIKASQTEMQAVSETGSAAPVVDLPERSPESLTQMLVPRTATEWIARILLTAVGLFAGFFIVPLAVFLQVRPPPDQKGRMIGVMNLSNWVGILLAAGFQGGVQAMLASMQVPLSWVFAVAALVLLPVALFYRPPADVEQPSVA